MVLGQETRSLGTGLSPARRRHVLDSLVKAGLVRIDGGEYRDSSEIFADLLAAVPRVAPRTGPERFLNGRGEIDRYPTNAAELHRLLTFIADRVLTAGEVVTEPELNERLTRFTSDTAGLRRHLVDADVLERTRSGSQYSRTVQPSDD